MSHFVILTQELRRDVEGIHSLTPQPEDPERSLDPASEVDPDIKVELIDGVFHQLSMDNALVAITADYPGLYPASQVIVTEVRTPLSLPCPFLTFANDGALQETPSRREAEPAAADQQGSVRPSRRKRSAARIETSPQRYGAPPFLRERFLGGILTLMIFPGERALAGQCPERLPIKPPPTMLHRVVRKWRRTHGKSRMLLRRRMPTGCPPPGLRWRVP